MNRVLYVSKLMKASEVRKICAEMRVNCEMNRKVLTRREVS
ncbi:hypothetical protein IIU_02689 [Bacillus cereus VD133]|uniref:Uncharacterized protein n=1 Tax=Bacillus cereus VD133 TaxID=1053233 RepID=A0A9W5V2R2_BACCE|nr:hypothetical protein [Bacillus cereus]EOO33949.1 hypothetical protein IIU_02689 [Bacillus cereus VD133]